MNIDTIVAIVALLLSLASFGFAAWTWDRKRKEDKIKNLLGDKESVAYAALRLLREGFPRGKNERATTIDAIIQACIFEGSDRARALLYRVIEQNLDKHGGEIRPVYTSFNRTFSEMERYNFHKDELDLEKPIRRLNALNKIVQVNDNAEQDSGVDG